MWPRAGEGPARFASRVCCSRRCALAKPATPAKVAARARLAEALRTVPDRVAQGPRRMVLAYLQAHVDASRALQRGAGKDTCDYWAKRLEEIAHG